MSSKSKRRTPNLPSVQPRAIGNAMPVHQQHPVTSTATVQSMQWRSPLPPAQELERLQKVAPNTNVLERMLKMTEEAQAHQHKMDEKIVKLDERALGVAEKSAIGHHRLRLVGLIFSFLLAVGAVTAATIAAWHGATSLAVAAIAGIGGGGGLVGIVWSRIARTQMPPPEPQPDQV